MRSIVVRVLVPAAAVALLAGCATHAQVKHADTVAKQGDWETALSQYRAAQRENPNDKSIADRVRHAEKEVAQQYLARAAAANQAGRLGEAGDLWKKAWDLDGDDATHQQIADAVTANESALEYFGDISMDYYSYDDAIGAYGALLLVRNDSVDLIERYRAAKREYAGDLNLTADDLTKRNLRGAALVASLRALQNDPMAPGAFDKASSLRKEMVGRTKVAVQEVKVEDKGYRALGLALVPRLTPKLTEFPPYGPTRDGNAIPGNFVVTIEEFSKEENAKKGVDLMPNTLPQPTEPVANPAIEEQKKKIAGMEKDLHKLQDDLKKTMPGKGAKQASGSLTKKKSLGLTDEQKRQAGVDAARKVDAKRKEISAAKVALAALPATVPPPPLPKTWNLPWTEVTRTVTARVKFELREKDMDQPVTVTMTRTVSHTDRTHDGNGVQGVMPDPLELPSFDAMCAELAGQFTDGANVIAQARTRRVEKLLANGRAKHAMGNDDEALESYIDAMFIAGPNALPADAQDLVGKASDVDSMDQIVAPPQAAKPQAMK
ncbi:MAG TPA: hypothetical protein VMV18_09700 [bacterium]|nr:hypothetical protein [bacterium]